MVVMRVHINKKAQNLYAAALDIAFSSAGVLKD